MAGKYPDSSGVFPVNNRWIRAVVLDCDGVMFDTTLANIAYYNQILGHFNRSAMTEKQVAFVQMHTVYESIAYLFDEDPRQVDAAMAFRDEMPYETFLAKMRMEPHLRSLLKRIRPEHYTAIATNRTDTIQRVLTAFDLDDAFDLVVSASDVERPKPHPDMLQKICDHFGIQGKRAVYIGDSELDEIAARSAGVNFIAFGNPSLSADFHIDTLSNVEACLQMYSNR